jgi:hypothetical protein
VLLSLHVFGIFGGKCILLAWTNGELLIWMDTDRGHCLEPIAKKFEARSCQTFLRWAVTLAPWEQLFRSRQTVKLLRKQPCKKPRRTCVIRKEMKLELLFFGIGKHFTDSFD